MWCWYLMTRGKLRSIDPLSEHDHTSVENYRGVLVPGFINAHCHLELSHMQGVIDTGTGLLPFITDVVGKRKMDDSFIQQAIENADREMYINGIVAVGDISNQLDTVGVKEKSPIRYYSFVEMFDFLDDSAAKSAFEQYLETYNGQSCANGNRKSCSPHAPYSVSKKLHKLIREFNPDDCTISIHMLETPEENELFVSKAGAFIQLFQNFGISLDNFRATGESSISYSLQHINPKNRILFVHNTIAQKLDIETAMRILEKIYFVSCPNANLYIENRLPDYKLFIDAGAKMCIGTDSLASNWQLSVFEEMKTISKFNSLDSL